MQIRFAKWRSKKTTGCFLYHNASRRLLAATNGFGNRYLQQQQQHVLYVTMLEPVLVLGSTILLSLMDSLHDLN